MRRIVAQAWLICGLVSVLAGCNGARDTALNIGSLPNGTGFVKKTLPTGRQYCVFVPKNYSASKKYPMIVFLHGIGEAGSDLKGPMTVGLAPFVADRVDSFDFFVLLPQSTGGWDENSRDAADVIAAIHEVERDYSVDAGQVSLTGLSTGGYGTFALGAKYNQEFAALVPMCPSEGDSKDGAALAKMNIWAFENAMDPFVFPGSMASTLSAIKSAGGNPKHTVYGAFGHDCWETAYGEGEIFAWLKQQHRGVQSAAAAPMSPAAARPAAQAATANPKATPAAPY